MRRIMLFILLTATLAAFSITAAQDGGASLTPVDAAPAANDVSVDATLTVYFDRAVDCDSAQSAYSITPDVAGELTCDDAQQSVTFTPDSSLVPGTTYTLAFDMSLTAQDETSLAEPFTYEVTTASYLEVAQVLPADDTAGIEVDSTITVIFNRPVVPLGIAEDADTLPQPLTFDPAVEGQGEWLNTSIYVFRPESGFAGGTTYTVTVDPDLVSVDGAAMAGAYSWSFSTVMPAISTAAPGENTRGVPLNTTVQVRFNQPMDHASTEASFSLHAADETESISGVFAWSADDMGFRFVPDEPLALDTRYEYGFTGDLPLAINGSAALPEPFAAHFTTVAYPSIVSTSPGDGEENVYPWGGFRITFGSKMRIDTLREHIRIDPEPLREFDAYYSEYNNGYTLSFPTEPSTDYTITITPGMEDIYGNVIDEGMVVRYTTAPYDPEVSLQVPGSVGVYNADNDQTRLFLTHLNVDAVDLALYSVTLDDFVHAVSGDNYYNPASELPQNDSSELRTWSIPSVAPENMRRYELLNLGGANAECLGALVSRLRVGDTAIVITDPDPLRARASVPDGEVIASLYKDYALPIVGGPVCADSMLWWEVTLREGETAWVAEGAAGAGAAVDEYFLDLHPDAGETPVAVTAADNEALEPGVYLLTAQADELWMRNIDPLKHIMVVATANLTLKYSADSLLVWATGISSGEPLANAPISVYDRSFNVIASGVTDDDGLLRVEVPRVDDLYEIRVAVLDDADQFGIGSTGWTDGIDGWNFGINTQYYPEEYRGYLYTDRPIYRPDQPVYFRGIIRASDDVTYTPPPFESVQVRIFDDQGEVIYEDELPLTPYGTFSGEFELAADAALGYYRIMAALPGVVPDNYYSSLAAVSFGVAEYRAPEFEVTVTPQTPEVVQDDTIIAAVSSRYFFGGAVSGATVDYSVVAQPYVFDYDGDGYYSFEDFNADAGPGEFYGGGGGLVTSGRGTTDADGVLLIEFPADLQDAMHSQAFTIEATVSDESGQAVSGRADVVVHQGLWYVGVQPAEYVAQAGEETAINLILVDWDSQPIPGEALDVEVVERRWSSVQEQDEAGRTTWTYEVEEIPVTTGDVVTDENGAAVFRFTPPNGGVFKITASVRDPQGNAVAASNTVWVSSREYVSWRQQNSNRIDLVADARDYEVGDTAEILITSPFQGTTEALVTVERGDVLKAERITMDSNSTVYTLPIEDDFAPNVFVSVVLVKGVDETNPVAGFRMGMVQLNVDNERKAITLDISTDVEQAGPGDTVTYTVRATDYAGEPVQAEIGVSLTDLAVMTLADPNSVPILGWFYGQQGISVRTATPLTINTDQITQTVLDTIKGGGGGFGEGGIFDIREEFVDTPYWNATLTTDADGVVTFAVTLPDNLTTWRLDARAVTAGDDGLTLVGQETFDLLSTKPVLIRPVTPRFFVVGDQVALGAVVNNNSPDDLTVEVTLQALGVTLSGETPSTQTVEIAAGQRGRVDWLVTVEDVANIDLTFFASGDDGAGAAYTDASKPPLGQGDARLLPVYKYEVPETVGTGGLLREAGQRTEGISLPRSMDVSEGELTVKLDSSLAATTIDGLTYLENFPYQCTEQTVSRFLPNIMTYRALEQLDLIDAALKMQLDANVSFALQRLYAQQHVDGGWGWFVQDESNALTTAYALIGLAEARAQGFNVSANVIRDAQNYLYGTFVTPGVHVPQWQMNRQAFALYALARAGSPNIARTTTLFEHRDQLSLYAKAFLAQALYMIDPDDTSRTDVLVSDLMNAAITSATGTHWDEDYRDYWNWNTDTRTTAIALQTLVTLMPDSELIPNIVRYLMVQRRADSWETTQETAWAVMALTDWMVVSGELHPDYSYTAQFNGETLAAGDVTPDDVRDSIELHVEVADMLAQEINNLVIGRTDGDGVLYYTAHLRVYLPVPEVEPLDRGIIIERRYTMPGSSEPVTSARVGDTLQVRLTVIVPNALHYVVIEDPIPAGTDAVDPNLETSQQIGTQPELNLDNPLSRGWGWWYFSNIEFRDEKVVLYSTYLPAGTYEYVYTIRAGLEGTYNVIPPTGYEFYFPEVYGRGAGSLFSIEAAAE